MTIVVTGMGCSDNGRTVEADDAETDGSEPGSVQSGAVIIAGLDSPDPQVVEVLQEMIEQAQSNPHSGRHRGTLGLAYEANGYETAALASYAQAEALAPGEFEWPYLQAMMLQQQALLDRALVRLDRAIELNPSYAPAWLWRGYWLLDEDRLELAAQAFQHAADLGAGAPAQVGQARVHLREDHPDLAVALLEPMSKKLDHPYVFRLLGNAWRAVGEIEQARAALERGKEARHFTWQDDVLDLKTEYIAGFGGRMLTAESLVAAGQAEDALPILEDLVEGRPEHPTLLNLLAVAYSQTGQKDRSLAILENAVVLAPEYYPIHLNLSGAYDDRGDYEKALGYIDQAIEIHPTFGVAHQRRGVVLMRMERHEDALAALDTAARYDAREPEVFYFAGAIESKFRRWPEAIERFQQALRVDPDFTKAHVHLARCLGELRRFEEARASLDSADRLGTHPQDVRAARAWLNRLEASGV